MGRMLRAFFDGLRLRCPRCHRGHMFTSWFKMNQTCPVCGLPFETASGEITGGMGINISVTLLLIIVAGAIIGFSNVALLPALIVFTLAVIVFPIAFYPVSRALWASILYLTGDNLEGD